MTTAETREAYCDLRHSAPPPERDLLDFCFALGGVELAALQLERLLREAHDHGAERGPVLRAHLGDLRQMQAELAALVSEAEAA